MVKLVVEFSVKRVFTIEGDNYCECWEVFKRELGLLHPDGRWETPSKLDRGRDASGLFADEQLSEHVRMHEFTSGNTQHPIEFYTENDDCPGCDLPDTLQFQLTQNQSGRLEPMAVCCNCGHKKLFCAEPKGSKRCETCNYRLDCLINQRR